MASELSSLDRKVIMANELSPGDSRTTSCPSKRAPGETSSGIGIAMSPTKRQKNGVVREKEVQGIMPQQGKSNFRSSEGEPLIVLDERGKAGDGSGSVNLEAQGNLEIPGVVEPVVPQRRPSRRHLGRPTDTEFEPESIAGKFRSLVCTLQDLEDRLEGRDKVDVLKAIRTTWVLGALCLRKTHLLAQMSGASGRPNSEPGDIDENNESLLAADVTAAGVNERESSDSPCSDSSGLGYSLGSELYLAAPASVSQRQQSDPELREKIHKVETDYWADRTARDVYNEERSKLYTEEEMKEARIVWPRREVQSPAGYREEILERGNYRCFDGGPSWDDSLYEFGCPFEENCGGDEEAAKQRLRDKIEMEFEDPEAKRAEYERWEKIRDVETKYYKNLVSRTGYNKRRFALYTEIEREEKSIVWPDKESGVCYSPAGFRDAVFDEYDQTEDGPDWQTRMDFHYPFADSSETTTGEENLCELCVPLIEENRDIRKEEEAMEEVAWEKRMQEGAKKRKEEMQEKEKKKEEKSLAKKSRLAWEKRMEEGAKKIKEEMQEKEKKKEEKSLAKKSGLPCAECNRKFVTNNALRQHASAKHKR